MTGIPDTEYITINKDGFFVGGKPVGLYHGERINYIHFVKENFTETQNKNPEIKELHVGTFACKGEYLQIGNPTKEFGPNVWCRVKLSDGRLGPWVFCATSSSTSDCVNNCADHCAYLARYEPAMLSALLNFVETDKINTENIETEQYETISVIKDGIYRLTIEKILQRTK